MISFSAFVLAVTLATLPLKQLVNFYMYLASGLLLLFAYMLSEAFLESEKITERAIDTIIVITDKSLWSRIVLHLVIQCIIAAMISYLLEIKNWTKFIFLIFTFPLVGHVLGFPLSVLEAVHNFSITFLIVIFAFNNLGVILDIAKEGINSVLAAGGQFGWIPTVLTFWHTVLLPVQLLIFWFSLFGVQIYVYWYSEKSNIMQEGWIIVVLASMGECCATPVSLFALCVTISYVSYYILTLTKLYLQGWNGLLHDNDMMRGWTEGFTMLLIAVQTGLLDLKPLQRAFLMSILLFIVVSSLIESMYEIADPVLLGLSASHNKNICKHLRAIGLCTFLWMFPLFMAYWICQYFDLDFWLLVIISSCLLTSVQVIGSLVIYALFMYDAMRSEPWEVLDDVIYYTRSTVRVLEFVVAVFVVCYGLKETLLGEWSWINSSILIIHCYFNVWQRLTSGWKVFLLRREAVKKLQSLPIATEEQLETYNDVCSICYQTMTSARITYCGHYFHAFCLRKWLYVKDVCPMCHKKIHKSDAEENVNATDDSENQNLNMQGGNTGEINHDNNESDNDDSESSDNDNTGSEDNESDNDL